MKRLKEFACDESGASAVEYGMLVALIAAVIVTVVAALGQDIKGAFDFVKTKLDTAVR
jgi:pilus assembly protein Flp/PilA